MENNTEIFGIPVMYGKREELLAAVAERIGKGGAVSTVNPEILNRALKNASLRTALCDSLCIPDGIGVAKALSIRGIKSERLPGVELGEELLDIAPVRVAIIGGRAGVAEAALENLTMRHKNVIPEFSADGYNVDEAKLASLIEEHRPDILFVCQGSPKQELLIYNVKRYSEKTLFIALGGSVDIYAGVKRRAPRSFRMLGTEWLYRVVREPSRLSRLPELFSFAVNFIKQEKKLHKTAEKRPKKAKILPKLNKN